MRRHGLSWKLLTGCSLVMLLALVVAHQVLRAELERQWNAALERELLTHARRIADIAARGWSPHEQAQVAQLAATLAGERINVLLLSGDGQTIFDYGRAAPLTAPLQRPEVLEALRSGQGSAATLGEHGRPVARAVAVHGPAPRQGAVVVRLARPLWRLAEDRRLAGRLALSLAGVGLAALATLAFALHYRWTRTLRRISIAAQSLSAGDFSVRADVAGTDEWAALGRALNATRRRLLVDAETIDRQRRTLESLLNQLGEGVIVVDGEGRVVLINPAAAALLSIDAPSDPARAGLSGRAVEECLPQHELQRLIHVARLAAATRGAAGAEPGGAAAAPPREAQFEVETPTGRMHILARLAEIVLPHPDQTGGALGWLLVLTDITELRRALTMQTDFVASASHELRTPLASIRAAVETLKTLDLKRETEAAAQFLDVVDRHTARLTALVADLLYLSRLDAGAVPAGPEPLDVEETLRALAERFAEAARKKGLHWETHAPPEGERRFVANAHLLQLVLDNLVDNAIKFTDAGGRVRVSGACAAGAVTFKVADTGCGIPEADRERVFERFYQVERARSGAARGTGLGLAIVRQAAGSLGGSVRIESQVGQGTVVTVTLPQAG